MLFVKFISSDKRDIGITMFNAVKKSFSYVESYMSIDLPLHQRTVFSFLLNFKRLLASWEFERVNFDDASGILSIAGDPILKVTTAGFTLKLDWLDEGWGKWEQLTTDTKFTALIKIAEDKLAKASQNSAKGKGKVRPA
jgi:hypothetical protein